MQQPEQIAVVFDSDCVLCAAWVQFLLRHERHHRMVFISAWSDIGAAMASKHGMDQAAFQKTFLVDCDGVGHTKSAAALALIAQLRWPWRAAGVLWLVPAPLRNLIYDIVARQRYKWFGRRENCFLPPPEYAHRFVNRDSLSR